MVIKCPEGWTGYSESLSCYKYIQLNKKRKIKKYFYLKIYIG